MRESGVAWHINAAVEYAQKKLGCKDEQAKKLLMRLHAMNEDIIDIVLKGSNIPFAATCMMLDQFMRRVDVDANKKKGYDEDHVSGMFLGGFISGFKMQKDIHFRTDNFTSIDNKRIDDVNRIEQIHVKLLDYDVTRLDTSRIFEMYSLLSLEDKDDFRKVIKQGSHESDSLESKVDKLLNASSTAQLGAQGLTGTGQERTLKETPAPAVPPPAIPSDKTPATPRVTVASSPDEPAVAPNKAFEQAPIDEAIPRSRNKS